MWQRSGQIPRIRERLAYVEAGARELRPDSEGLPVLIESQGQLSLRHKQITQKIMSLRAAGIGIQRCFNLVLRFLETVHPGERERVIKSRREIVRLISDGGLEVIASLRETAARRKRVTQIAVRFRVTRQDSNRLPKGRLRAWQFSALKPHSTQTVPGLGHIRIEVDSLFERCDGVGLCALREIIE